MVIFPQLTAYLIYQTDFFESTTVVLRVGRIVTNAGLLAGRSWAAAVWLSKGGDGSCLYTVKRVWLAALRDLNPLLYPHHHLSFSYTTLFHRPVTTTLLLIRFQVPCSF